MRDSDAQWAALRRDLHAHPETGFEERRTSEIVAEKLQSMGIAVHRGLGGTGVVGVLHGRDGGACGRGVGLRADMDALPVQEGNRFAHASVHAGRMHACGHDGHTAMLLAAAQDLASARDFDGTVYLIFQPAEEINGGARRMIDDGLFDRFPMQAVFGMHNWPGGRPGDFQVGGGPVMASTNRFRILVRGVSAHGAMPDQGIDPVLAACQLVVALQGVVSRNTRPIDAAVLSVTMVHAGEAVNVIPEACELRGTVRAFDSGVLDRIEARMEKTANGICDAMGAECEFEFERLCPPTVNAQREAALAREVIAELFGNERVAVQEPTMGAEDFAFMLQAKPGAYVFMANGDGSHRAAGHGRGPCVLHNPAYDFNDELIPLGRAYWSALARRWLGQAGAPTQVRHA